MSNTEEYYRELDLRMVDYAQGWEEACKWAKRDDLLFDMESPAYEKARDARLGI